MPKAIAYLRCSTLAQSESGLGLEAQRASVTQAATRLNLSLAALYTDEGLSGGLPLSERPGLLDAVGMLGRGDVLIVAARSRLGRDVVNTALVEREVTRRGARIMSAAGEGSELEGPTGDLVRTILDAVNAFEKAQVALRTRAALRAKRARGERAGNCPFGYRADPTGHLEPDDREQKIIAQVKNARGRGLSERMIAAELHEQGFVGRTGRPLGRVQINRILRAA